MFRRFRSVENTGAVLPFFLKNWWVMAFILMAFALYFQGLYQKNQLVSLLEEKSQGLKREREVATQSKEQLLLRLQSQEDPNWGELVLKQRLGVVAEGETKVVFFKGEL